ncbi:uncharacterized protein LOC123200825 [Mangifera indica]|uniref:uncharacterized protein LOC123200825 n=1 Tax=Mangifera indica TaxID=29780 RepID=UPI001CF9A047|nr:uncharacterized protein LOC123200825 [Mangifera indica]
MKGDGEESQTKLSVLGKASLNLPEVAATVESQVERKVPITSKVGGLGSEATLSVSSISMSDLNSSHFKQRNPQYNPIFCSGVREFGGGNDSTEKSDTELNSRTESESYPGSETQLEPPPQRKEGLFSWKRRRLSFIPLKKKEPLSKKTNENKNTDGSVLASECYQFCDWEEKVASRDGQSKLKANVFFASFDQRSEKTCGEGACTALVAAIAHWLHQNQDFMPTRSELDRLITQGSSDWRKLCDNETYTNFFPDKHFDLETVLEAGLQPIHVLPDKSFTGFFSPDKFQCLHGGMSFDEIWDEIND